MGIGVSIFLFAVGAVLAFAVDVTTEGIDLDVVGVILMLVGGAGLLVSMLFWGNTGPYRDERMEVHRDVRPYRAERRVTRTTEREAL